MEQVPVSGFLLCSFQSQMDRNWLILWNQQVWRNLTKFQLLRNSPWVDQIIGSNMIFGIQVVTTLPWTFSMILWRLIRSLEIKFLWRRDSFSGSVWNVKQVSLKNIVSLVENTAQLILEVQNSQAKRLSLKISDRCVFIIKLTKSKIIDKFSGIIWKLYIKSAITNLMRTALCSLATKRSKA